MLQVECVCLCMYKYIHACPALLATMLLKKLSHYSQKEKCLRIGNSRPSISLSFPLCLCLCPSPLPLPCFPVIFNITLRAYSPRARHYPGHVVRRCAECGDGLTLWPGCAGRRGAACLLSCAGTGDAAWEARYGWTWTLAHSNRNVMTDWKPARIL